MVGFQFNFNRFNGVEKIVDEKNDNIPYMAFPQKLVYTKFGVDNSLSWVTGVIRNLSKTKRELYQTYIF